MAINFQPLVAESLAKQIAENIRNAIMDGSLKVDEKLPTEEILAKKFNVSRPTIREALKRLAAQNLIRSRRGPTGGTFVNCPSQEDLRSSLTESANRRIPRRLTWISVRQTFVFIELWLMRPKIRF